MFEQTTINDERLGPTCRDERGKRLGDDLRSQAVARQVPSALESLTTGFEMGPGVPSPLQTPRKFPRSSLPAGTSHTKNKRMKNTDKANVFCAILRNASAPEEQALRAKECFSQKKPSTISIGKLHALLRLHSQPIKQVVCLRSYPVARRGNSSRDMLPT
jgi:hypothetical protein